MKKLVVAAGLAFASMSLACSPKGYAANGAVQAPAGVAVTCQGKIFDDAQATFKTARWIEVAMTPHTAQGAQSMGELLKRLERTGYARQSVKKASGGLIFRYTKKDREIDALVVSSAAAAYMLLIGK